MMEQQTEVTIQKLSIDNRTVIEVKGKRIVLSEVKLGIESMLSKIEVHEVRIYAGISLSVDTNLSRDVWHGRNLVVLANEIKVNNAVTWDVSGKDNDYAYTSNAGTGEDGLGKDGSDGYPGESGGNVLVQANTIQNSERLTIISNGGDGGCGQDGGNGQDGADGLGISRENFEEYFPYSSMVSRSERIARITKIVQNIYDMSKSVQIEWMKLKSTDNETGDIVEGNLLEHLKENNCFDIYLHVGTHEGNEIMFSLWDETTQCHSFLVYKGSPGHRGKSGGKYGTGGQGGFPGEIAVMGLNSRMKFGICSQKTWGNDGTNGAGGFNGSYGQNGWDMGFFGDLSFNVTIYGANQNSKLEPIYHEKSSSDNIYHPYMANQSECNKYVTIHEVKNDPYFIRERNNAIARKERQNHSRAIGKKSVPRMRIAAAFSEYLREIERERKEWDRQRTETEAYVKQKIEEEKREKERKNNLKSEKERNEKEKQEMEENLFEKEQLEKLDKQRTENRITNLRIKRYVHYSQEPGQYLVEFVKLGKMYNNGRKKKIVKDLKDNLRIEMWLQLQAVTIDLPELSILVENFKALKPNFHNLLDNAVRIRINAIAKTLKMKYKFAILKEIALKLPIYHDQVSKVILSTPQETKYLEETRIQDDSKKHPVLGTLRHYIFGNSSEQRRRFSEFVDKTFKTRQGKTFSSLYDRLTHDENAKAFWERCCVDEQMLKTFQKHWEQEGFISKYYRALLANVYDVNIRLYTRDADGKIVLLEEHNPTSFKTTSILLKSNKPTQLEFNHKYCQLEEERLHKDEIYRRILRDVSAMRSINALKRYFKKELYNHTNFGWVKKSDKLDEEVAIGRITAFFPAEERKLIAQRLKSISSQNTGQEGVFESLLERFSFEGCHVSLNELCFLINSILSHTIEARQERFTFSWIISAYNQCNWTDELVLLQLENYFKSQLRKKAEWRSYMSNIRNKGVLLVFAAQFARKPCSAQCVEEILHLLSHMPIESVCLDQLELTEWPFALKKYYWTLKLQSLTTWDNIHNLTSAIYFILSIENNHGKDKLEKLFEILKGKRDDLRSAWFNEILKCFHNQKWIMYDDVLDILKDKSLRVWQKHLNDTNKISSEELNVSQIANIIQGNANTSNKIKGHLANIQVSVQNIKQNQTLLNDQLISSFTVDDIKEWSETFRKTKTDSSFEKYEEMLAVVDRAVELKRGFRLRDTQLLTVLALLANDKKTLAQVSTGEGKTLIVVAIAVIKGLLGEKVDIITSSPVLAQRDASKNQDIYELFGLSASHNCSESMEERMGAYSLNQIVYGDLANFLRDYLLDSFYGKHLLKDRSFDNVIVDEVDSMLLDKENSMLNLSHHIAGVDMLESLYVFIWQMVNIQTDFTKDKHIETIKRSVLSDMYPSIEEKDIASLDKAMGKSNVLHLWERLVMSGIINGSGRLLTEVIDSNTLDEAVSPDFTQYKDRLSFLLRSRIERNTYINVPNFLKPFVERHLDSWISSAITALNMDPKQYYVVDVDRSGTSAGRHANVIILERDTGFDQHSSQLDEALHQFLQLKHGCKLSTQNLKAVFISNVTYFKMYKLLYGLSGTLGSQPERHLLEDIHQVEFLTIPTAMPKQFEEYEPIICSSKDTWMHYIREEANKLITTDKRSVLIICETIRDVESLTEMLDLGNSINVHTYVRDYEKFSFADGDKMLEPGQIIIATNLARHGSSIKLSNELRNAGGLHVILTYLPVNIRIEEQAFGRAARSGDKGSGRMIIMVSDGEAQNRSLIYKLKQKRNVEELIHISALKSYYETTIKTEEYCFKTFKELFIRKMKCLGNAITSDPVKEILLQSCLDKWSYWLDENNALLRRSLDEATKRQVEKCLDQFIVQFDDLQAIDATSWSAWVEGNPMQMIKLAKFIAQHEPTHLETALHLFEKVIKNEPHFCEAAYYYRAYTRLLNNMNIEDFKTDLRMAERLLDERVQSTLHASDVLGKLKTSSPQIEGYEEQKKSVINLYSFFIQSINDMLGHGPTPDLFVNDEIEKDVAGKIFEDLMQIGMIKKTELVGNVTDAQLHKFHSDYWISVEILKQFFASNEGTMDEEELLGSIRRSFSFPSRSEFWETLVKQNVLHSVKKYVAINVERLGTDKCELMNVIQEKVDEGKLVKDTVRFEKNQVLLIHEQHSMTYFEENKLIGVTGNTNFFALKEKGLLSFNEMATIDKSKIADCVFSTFDSITAEDITNKARITISEANIIIDELLRQKVLKKRGESYALSDKFDQDILLPTYPLYENVIRSVLKSCFAYRLALRNIVLQLEDKVCSEIRIKLEGDPHLMFINDLLEQKIIQPPSLNETFDVDEAVEKLCKNHRNTISSSAAYHVKNVLNESKSSLAALNKSKGSLKSILLLQSKLGERKELFINIDEMRIFITNGLEHLVQLTDKKWTAERMFNNTATILRQRGQAFNDVRLRPVNTRIPKINHEQNPNLPNMIVETKRRLTEEYYKQTKKIKKKPPKSDDHLRESSYGLGLRKYLCFYGT